MIGIHNNGRTYAADGMLILSGLMWGASIIFIKLAVAHTSPINLLFLRFTLASLLLLPVAWARRGAFKSDYLIPGAVIGLLLFTAFLCQAWGLVYTSASRAALITGLFVVLVPLFSIMIWRIIPAPTALAGAALAFTGLYLLTSLDQSMAGGLNLGDVLVLGCAVFGAGHILTVGRLSPGRDSFWLAFIQFATVAVCGALWAGISGDMDFNMPGIVWWSVGFLALGCTILGFWGQVWAQSYVPPTRTAVIFTLEPVFGAIFAYLFLGERIGPWGYLGGAVIVAGLILAEIKPRRWNLPMKRRAAALRQP